MDKVEYEIQHFDFSAAQVSLERKYLLRQNITTALKDMAKKLTSSKEKQVLLLQQEEEVGRRIFDSFNEQLEVASSLDRKYFSIPNYVLLAPDFKQVKQYSHEDERRTDEQLAEMKQLFLENSIMIAALKMQNEQYASLESDIEDEINVHSLILESYKAADVKKWRTLFEETKDLMEFK